MPLFIAIGTVVSLLSFSFPTWRLISICLFFEVFSLTSLYWGVKRFFRGVELKPEEVQRHLDFYSKDGAETDEEMKKRRLKEYKTVALNYYNFASQLFHKIWSPHYSMGLLFPTEDRLRWMNYPQAQSVYQCFLAHSLCMKETGTYGDFGCGIGGPTRCIAQFSGAKIKAVNINPGHLRLMRRYNEEANIAHRIELIEADYHNTGLPSSSLDGVYMCESAACTFDHKVLCKEVFRVLKPGARFAGFDWQMTDKFDESNKEHREIRFLLELGVGVPRLVPMSYMREALLEAGFEIEELRNHSDFGVSLGSRSWDSLFDEYKSKFFLTSFVRVLLVCASWLNLCSAQTVRALDVLVACREGMVRGGPQQLDIFSPMIYWRARKPKAKPRQQSK